MVNALFRSTIFHRMTHGKCIIPSLALILGQLILIYITFNLSCYKDGPNKR
jgi:hypothetical protein